MILLRQFFKLFRFVFSEFSPFSLTSGLVLGMFLGFTPISTLHWWAFLFLILIFRINIAVTLGSTVFFGVLAYFLDPLFHRMGLFALTKSAPLLPLWQWMGNAPLLPFTRFNNTIVMGSFLLSLLLLIPLGIISWFLVAKFRARWVAWVETSRFWRPA